MRAQHVSAITGPPKEDCITLDLDLYQRALKLQKSNKNNWVLCAGTLHIVFALLHALGKTVDSSGLDICAIEKGLYTAASLRKIYVGKAYKRGMEYHLTQVLAIMILKFDAIFLRVPSPELFATLEFFLKAVHNNQDDILSVYNQLIKEMQPVLKEMKSTSNQSGIAEFLTAYTDQVYNLLQVIECCRLADFEGFLTNLDCSIRYLFSKDLLNYARLMPVYVGDMYTLKADDPVTWEALTSGDFVVNNSNIAFSNLFTDQALEQEIKKTEITWWNSWDKSTGNCVRTSFDHISISLSNG